MVGLAMKKVASGRLQIAYHEAGVGEPTVVLLHAPLGFRPQMQPLFDHLSQSHRVIAPDLRGTGSSDAPESGYTIADYARDVVAVCRDAGASRVVLCGHSLGGAIALDAAAMEPAMVAGVVLLDGAVLFPDALRARILEELVPALEGPGRLEALRGYFASRMFAPFDPPELQGRILESLGALPPQVAAAVMRDALDRDFGPRIAAGRYPLMFIHARVPADLDRLRQLRPDAIIASVAGSGHFMAEIVPDQVNAMLDRFLTILPQAVSV
jgi:pimeloyl-ACP methyl ester carboxylesterase